MSIHPPLFFDGEKARSSPFFDLALPALFHHLEQLTRKIDAKGDEKPTPKTRRLYVTSARDIQNVARYRLDELYQGFEPSEATARVKAFTALTNEKRHEFIALWIWFCLEADVISMDSGLMGKVKGGYQPGPFRIAVLFDGQELSMPQYPDTLRIVVPSEVFQSYV